MRTPAQIADALDEGISADIFYDAHDHDDESAETTIENFQHACGEAMTILRALDTPGEWLATVEDEDGDRILSEVFGGDYSLDQIRLNAMRHFGDLPAGHNLRFYPIGPERVDMARGFAGDLPGTPASPEVRVTEVDESALDDDGKVPWLPRHRAASQELVDLVMSKETGGMDGRSEWRWFRLPNGDLILGVFPQGDTYFAVEGEASF